MSQIVRDFIAYAESEAPELAHKLDRVVDEPVLADLLARFDAQKKRTLSWRQSQLAHGMLEKLETPSAKALALLGDVLSSLGLSALTVGDADVELAGEVLDLFCRADSVNDTLSTEELRMLLAVLAKLDNDSDGVLDAHERMELRNGLSEGDVFLAELLAD